jgi:hypothetical protein
MTRTREENAADLAREQAWLDSLVPIYIGIMGAPSHDDDRGVPGIYLAKVDPDLTVEKKVEAALEMFGQDGCHIECPDDFTIIVCDGKGNLLPRNTNLGEIGLRSTPTAWNLGRFEGFVEPEDVPPVINNALSLPGTSAPRV